MTITKKVLYKIEDFIPIPAKLHKLPSSFKPKKAPYQSKYPLTIMVPGQSFFVKLADVNMSIESLQATLNTVARYYRVRIVTRRLMESGNLGIRCWLTHNMRSF